VLSPPRSGSTLLRVMLGGHPQLFAPPELELLSFNTWPSGTPLLLSATASGWKDAAGLMQIKECAAEQAKELMQQCWRSNLPRPVLWFAARLAR